MADNNKNFNNSQQNFEMTVGFLKTILDKTISFVRHIDNQIQILLGISLAIFIFCANQLNSEVGGKELYLLVLAFFSIVATLFGLFAIHPPGFMRKRGLKESLGSLMYNKKITGFPSSQEYYNEIQKIAQNPEEIIRQYSTEIYTLLKYYYSPKRRLFHFTRDIFLIGLILSFLLLVLKFLKFLRF